MTVNAAFYTLSTIAQTLGAVLGIGGAFVGYRMQQVLSLLPTHADNLHASPINFPDKHNWPMRVFGGDLRGFILIFYWAAIDAGVDPTTAPSMRTAMNIAQLGQLYRHVRRWFRASLGFGIPTIMCSIGFLPITEHIVDAVPWMIGVLVLTSVFTLVCFAKMSLPIVASEAEDCGLQKQIDKALVEVRKRRPN